MSREEGLPVGGNEEALERELQVRRSALRRYQQVEAAVPRPAFAAALRERLVARHDAAQLQTRTDGWRVVIARLFNPPASQLQAAGIRGGALRLARYIAEDLTIMLKIEEFGAPGSAQLTVYGALDSSVLDDRMLSAVTVDLEGPVARKAATVDDLGNFMLVGIPVGMYRLTLMLPDQRSVVLDSLSLTV